MDMKFIKIGALALLAVAAAVAVVFLAGSDDIESAVGDFEDGDYIDSLVTLKKLAAAADYESGERIYYYRCRAINALADQMEKDYDEELRAVSLEYEKGSKRDRAKRELEEKLAAVNAKTDGDLVLAVGRRNSRIVSRGSFYDEFVGGYKGSRLIEDLDFEELKKVEKTAGDRLLRAVADFYGRYPGSLYLSAMVKMIFRGVEEGTLSVKGSEDLLARLIADYGRRYPASPEMQRLYVCTGSDVNLRNSAGTVGQVVGKIKKDEVLIQLEKSMDTYQVGDVRDYWYRVAALTGLKGWIFGKFLSPYRAQAESPEGQAGLWSVEDNFTDWDDSNTPRNWMHIAGGDRSAISFGAGAGSGSRIVKLNAPKGTAAGLYRRFDSAGSFGLCARARFIAGNSFALIAYVMKNGSTYYLRLREEEIDLSGRKIPVHTSDWHEYLLESDDGKHARLTVDGEVLLNRVPPVMDAGFPERGVYCLYSSEGEASLGELEYVKLRQ